MARLIVFIALFAFASAAIRIPMLKKQDHVLSMDHIRVERNYLMEKYHSAVEDDSQECVENIDHFINNQFYAEISVGTPPQILNAVFDTTISILYVSEQNYESWSGFNVNASSTAEIISTDNVAELEYGISGEAANSIYLQDIFDIAGINVPLDFAVSNMTFDNTTMVFGLMVKLSEYLSPPLYYMHQQQIINSLEYSIYYDTTKGSDYGGHVILGGVDSSVYSGELTQQPLNTSYGQIAINVDSIYMYGYDIASQIQVVIDSGSNLITLPVSAFLAISRQLDGAIDNEGNYFVDCDQIDSLPNVTVTIGGSAFTIPPQSYILRVSNGLTPCMSGFTLSNQVDLYTFGLPFLTQVYTVVNVTDETISFGTLA